MCSLATEQLTRNASLFEFGSRGDIDNFTQHTNATDNNELAYFLAGALTSGQNEHLKAAEYLAHRYYTKIGLDIQINISIAIGEYASDEAFRYPEIVFRIRDNVSSILSLLPFSDTLLRQFVLCGAIKAKKADRIKLIMKNIAFGQHGLQDPLSLTMIGEMIGQYFSENVYRMFNINEREELKEGFVRGVCTTGDESFIKRFVCINTFYALAMNIFIVNKHDKLYMKYYDTKQPMEIHFEHLKTACQTDQPKVVLFILMRHKISSDVQYQEFLTNAIISNCSDEVLIELTGFFSYVSIFNIPFGTRPSLIDKLAFVLKQDEIGIHLGSYNDIDLSFLIIKLLKRGVPVEKLTELEGFHEIQHRMELQFCQHLSALDVWFSYRNISVVIANYLKLC